MADLLQVLAMATLVAAVSCSFMKRSAQRDWIPRSWREFMMPRCPLCWSGRAALICLVVLWIVR